MCFDESNLTADADPERIKSTLYACVSLALQQGTAPVLFTVPAYTGPSAKNPKAVTQYNDIVEEVARVAHVPLVDATRILNEDERDYDTLFDRSRRLRPSAFDAVNEHFLKLYASLETWVFGR
jgi:hypothetical protein